MEVNIEYLCENTDLLQKLEVNILDCNEEEYLMFERIKDKLVITSGEYARHDTIDI